jgi:hypothetical protein
MATDPTGRRVVNATMAAAFKSSPMGLVRERRYLNLNYGSMFVAHALIANGTDIGYMDLALRQGKNIFEIADGLKVDWARLADDAKKLNRKIEENLYLHFLHDRRDPAQDSVEGYQLGADGVPADNDVSDGQIDQAQTVYAFLHHRAAEVSRTYGDMDTAHQQAARMDHTRLGGPQKGGGSLAPEAGGLPPN